MIDLHSHILPGMDDGAPTLGTALEMARIAAADGTTHLACTPHIMLGVYDNHAEGIERAVAALSACLVEAGLALELAVGADVHACPDIGERLCAGGMPTINRSRFFLLELPRDICPPGMPRLVRRVVARGCVPIVTHPERLAWIEERYDVISQLAEAGALMQLTAASITGGFGSRARYWAERMLDEARVDLVASDAHDARRRPPGLSRAREHISTRCGAAFARRLTEDVPKAILADAEIPAMRHGFHARAPAVP